MQTEIMANHRILKPFILKWEGGFANDPNDLGGATMKGITLDTYKAYCRRKGYPQPTIERLKNIPDKHWEEIYKTLYWDRWKADLIRSQRVANILVDWVWHSGKHGIIRPQMVLGVTADGIVGNKTITAVNQAGDKLFDALWQDRVSFLTSIAKSRPQNAKFLRGWLNRLNDLKRL